MDTIKLFYSWQRDNKIARKTIQKAIEKTIKKLNKSDKIFELITDSREGKGSEQISLLSKFYGQENIFGCSCFEVSTFEQTTSQ